MEGSRREGKEWGTVTVLTVCMREHAGDRCLVYKPDTTHSVLNLHTLYTHAYSTYCRAYVWITSYRLLHTVTCTYVHCVIVNVWSMMHWRIYCSSPEGECNKEPMHH